ncbi:hypothetical protein N7448_010406 [Penicillium atrosanguineum]|uniref:glutathione-specific gamma-glutamylcyclotransferase n=1 Tax=Penicillium atrosanguineum TaxID=1132637 RepID=A0A9W9PNQ5_9EURO|nr:uncharacterized protein N7443_007631 [Penicillium atrosanguineum]KAJ5118699.1 hypothetical protein N7526_010336 [Penicillium atrosanguineum]KAJ5119737.1 hypothetical protein N7448_010406 [Penicillium atrosanguineum]KAJ5296738.1 hypothetical protein N7443_007631 [Penicillium atrosanguineum]KAJ5299497.1 hypothetical protein N7476_011054 [Penicillium atrosanguineum]
MAASLQGHQVHPGGRTWKSHFPNGDLWVFGYGSLIWKPPPHYDQRVPGYIDGYVRRFWQLAKVESESASTGKVWGAAYHIPSSHAEEVHDYLDEREIDGYSVHYTPFHPFSEGSTMVAGDLAPIICMVYIGQPSNPQFLRDPAQREPQDVAQFISAGHGQSGKGTEYLYLLEKSLQGLGLGTADVHVTDLVRRVKAIEAVGEGEEEEREAEENVKRSLATAEAVAKGDNIE